MSNSLVKMYKKLIPNNKQDSASPDDFTTTSMFARTMYSGEESGRFQVDRYTKSGQDHINDLFSEDCIPTGQDLMIDLKLCVTTSKNESRERLMALMEVWVDEYKGKELDYTLLTALYAMAVLLLKQEDPRKWSCERTMISKICCESTLSTIGPIGFRWNITTGMGSSRITIDFCASVKHSKRQGRQLWEECDSSGKLAVFLGYAGYLGVLLDQKGGITRCSS